MRHLFTMALAVFMAFAVPQAARAAIVTVNWSYEITSWDGGVQVPVPTSASGTVTFDTSILNPTQSLTTPFTSNFGATFGEWSFVPGSGPNDGLLITLFTSASGWVAAYFTSAGVMSGADFCCDFLAEATAFSGSFALVPAPGSLALLGAGLIGLGVARRRRRA